MKINNNLTTTEWATIFVARYSDASKHDAVISWKSRITMWYTKYSIKESDMRIKTATFDSPQFIDLTTGLYAVKIVSPYHENFAGIILDVDYDEDKGIYSYQCQDFSRLYISKFELIANKVKKYNLLRYLITRGRIGLKPTKKQLSKYKKILSGLRGLSLYDQNLYKGNRFKGNPFNQNASIIARDKSWIEVIRSVVFESLGFYDVWFNDMGILQIQPLSKTDWENTGLHLTDKEYSDRQFKFSTTNAITDVVANGSDTKKGKTFTTSDLIGLNLNAFFGNITTSVSNQTNSTKKTSTTKSTKKTTTNKDNPYGNKAKKIWIGADGGSGSFTQEICRLLEKNGWYVHYSGEGAGVHNDDYDNVTSDYQILGIVDNGFCCTTIKEAYEGYCAPTLKRKNVTVMFMFDTRDWTDPDGMKPFRYGDFGNHVFHTAWDDSSGYCTSMNATAFFKKHKAVYCASPTAQGMVNMFLKGGYFASKGIQV